MRNIYKTLVVKHRRVSSGRPMTGWLVELEMFL
jgi:hypothetical protein